MQVGPCSWSTQRSTCDLLGTLQQSAGLRACRCWCTHVLQLVVSPSITHSSKLHSCRHTSAIAAAAPPCAPAPSAQPPPVWLPCCPIYRQVPLPAGGPRAGVGVRQVRRGLQVRHGERLFCPFLVLVSAEVHCGLAAARLQDLFRSSQPAAADFACHAVSTQLTILFCPSPLNPADQRQLLPRPLPPARHHAWCAAAAWHAVCHCCTGKRPPACCCCMAARESQPARHLVSPHRPFAHPHPPPSPPCRCRCPAGVLQVEAMAQLGGIIMIDPKNAAQQVGRRVAGSVRWLDGWVGGWVA